MKTLTDVALVAFLTETETLMAPAVLGRFMATAGYTRQHMIDELLENEPLRDYFAEVCRKVANSPQGREVAAAYAAQK